MEFFATSNGIPVLISDTKSGNETLLLLHGYLETYSVWQPLISSLSKEIRVITLDLPGHGLSGTHPTVNSLDFCADVIKGVLDLCEVSNVTILGHSMGGYIAIEFLKKYPEYVKQLVLMHSTPYADDDLKKIDRDREISLIEMGKMMTIVKIGIPKMFAPSNMSRMEEKILEITELSETHDPEGIIASIRGLRDRPDNSDFLKGVSVPIMLFFGVEDNYISQEVVNRLVSLLPKANTVILKNSGHNGFLEETENVARELSLFLHIPEKAS